MGPSSESSPPENGLVTTRLPCPIFMVLLISPHLMAGSTGKQLGQRVVGGAPACITHGAWGSGAEQRARVPFLSGSKHFLTVVMPSYSLLIVPFVLFACIRFAGSYLLYGTFPSKECFC